MAKETDDPDVVAATMSKPGVVLKRPAGSSGRFAEHSDLPSDLGSAGKGKRREGHGAKPAKKARPEISEPDARKAAAEFEKEQKRREAERRREEAARERDRERREKAVAKAQAALDEAEREHEKKAADINTEIESLEKRCEPRTTAGKRKENDCRSRFAARGSRVEANKMRSFTLPTPVGFGHGAE